MKIKIIIFLFIFLPHYSIAQLPAWYQNLEKYWWYRYRLVNDFMKIGDGPGESMPAVHRQMNHTGNNNYSNSNNPVVHQQGQMKWSDGTTHLGLYIQMLATEYRQLANNNWSTTRTEYELQKALNTFDRLDAYGEQYCYMINGNYVGAYPAPGYPTTPFSPANWKNGFFVRDDVPYLNFVENNMKHFNRPGHIQLHKQVGSTVEANFSGHYEGPYPSNSSIIPGWPNNPPPYSGSGDNFPGMVSQDQIAEIFAGTGLVHKFVNNASLKAQSDDILYDIINWTTHYDPPLTWQIKNATNHKDVPAGPTFMFQARGATEGLHLMLNTGATTTLRNKGFLFDWAFQIMQFFSPGNNFSLKINDYFASFSDVWQFPPKPPFLPSWVPWPAFPTTWKTILKHSMHTQFSYPHMPLLFKLNYPGNGLNGFCPECHTGPLGQLPSYINLLDWAPKCGTWNYGVANYGNIYWSSDNMLTEPYHRKNMVSLYPNQAGYDNADYNGIDYMLLFNCFSLVHGSYLGGMMNSYYRENFNVNYPTSTNLGSTSQKLNLNFLEYASFINKIFTGGNLKVRGAKQLVLLPGFDSQLGAVSDFYIKDYFIECDDNSSEDYHYATVTTPFVYPFKTLNGDSSISGEQTEPIALYDGPYVPQATPVSYPQDTTEITDEMMEAMMDSYEQQVLATGDTSLINMFYAYTGRTPKQALSTALDNAQCDLLTLHPNPTQNDFTITTPKQGNYTIKISDMPGKTIYTDQIKDDNQLLISTRNMLPGTYTVQIFGNNIFCVKKIVIVH